MINLVVFLVMLKVASPDQLIWIGRIFFIWVSVFNLFVISVFWSFIVDVFNSEQGKRLFGVLAAGSTLGGIAGSAITSGLVDKLGQSWLLLVSIVLLEVAVFASKRLSLVSKAFHTPAQMADKSQVRIGGGIFAGMLHTFRSPYLLGISAFILFYTITSTFLYFHQASIVEVHFTDRVSKTAFFANIDLWVNILTLVVQVFLTGRLVRKLGMAVTLCILPFISLLGFAGLASFPLVAVFVVVQVGRRVANFSMARPAREILFTSLSREDRYKAKNFIDTVVYRTGDQMASWSYAGLTAIGLGITSIAWFAVPLSAIWIALSFWLGRQQVKESVVVETAEERLPDVAEYEPARSRSMGVV
jgi:AAA family ATP:ADP antiporter